MKHILIASLLVVIVTALVILGLQSADLLPQVASAEGELVDRLFSWQIYAIAFFFSLILVFVLYSVVVFRRRPGETGDGAYVKGHTGLEITWTLVPLAIVTVYGALSAQDLSVITAPEPGERVVEVTGFQFGWQFGYPDAGVTSRELYLPRGQQILFRITSNDVIHSFWVPEFRVKQDAVPGRWTELRVTPTEVGDFRVRCAELCGYAHAAMFAPVVVVEPDEFEAWLAGQEVAAPPSEEMPLAEQGAALAELQGCLSCHTTDGTPLVGPTWLGLYGSERPLEDGTTVVADEEYLHRSIVEPQEQVVEGFPNVMPAAYQLLSDEDLNALIEYVKSLGE